MNGQKTVDVLGRALVSLRNELQKHAEKGTGIVFIELSASYIPTFDGVDMQVIAELHILDTKSGLVTVLHQDFEAELGVVDNGE